MTPPEKLNGHEWVCLCSRRPAPVFMVSKGRTRKKTSPHENLMSTKWSGTRSNSHPNGCVLFNPSKWLRGPPLGLPFKTFKTTKFSGGGTFKTGETHMSPLKLDRRLYVSSVLEQDWLLHAMNWTEAMRCLKTLGVLGGEVEK